MSNAALGHVTPECIDDGKHESERFYENLESSRSMVKPLVCPCGTCTGLFSDTLQTNAALS